MHKLKSLQNSQPASINSAETLQDLLTRTALEFKALQMKLNPHHLPIENNDTIHELLE